MPPVGAAHIDPPFVMIAKTGAARRLAEDDRRRREQLGFGIRIVIVVGRFLGKRYVTGGVDKTGELPVCHSVPVHPETVDLDTSRHVP